MIRVPFSFSRLSPRREEGRGKCSTGITLFRYRWILFWLTLVDFCCLRLYHLLMPHQALLLPLVGKDSPFHHRQKPELPSCRVAVTNSEPTHYETLESVAGLLPLQYLNQQRTSSCDPSSLIFDYHVLEESKRVQSWAVYFRTKLMGKAITGKRTSEPQRSIGDLYLYSEKPESGILNPEGSYTAVVEASCYCRKQPTNHVKWLESEDHRTCIFHEKCPKVSDHPRALWPSPHHKHHYIPTALPMFPPKPADDGDEPDAPHRLCAIGTTKRRNWGLLQQFMDGAEASDLKRFQILILGFGDFPKQLEAYRNRTQMESPNDYLEFHRRVALDCHAILLLVTKNSHTDYFLGAKSLLKLSGTIPIVLAYRMPVMMHQELYILYRDYMPPDLLPHYATHTDDPETFTTAMRDLLDQLDQSAVQ